MNRAAILVSPAPIDGYPPVQHQALLLAEAGFAVEVITTSLAIESGTIDFHAERVTCRSVRSVRGRGVATLFRFVKFVYAIAAARRAHRGRQIVEIVYDPQGIAFSDFVPFRPKRRIAHLHECLQNLENEWAQRRLKTAMQSFHLVVVADHERAKLLVEQLGLPRLPESVPNYPLANTGEPAAVQLQDGSFEVVYAGSIGYQQKLDVIIQSIPLWPPNAHFVIIGNDRTEIARNLKNLVADLCIQNRVRFEGWVCYSKLRKHLERAHLGVSFLDPFYEQWRTALGASNKRYQYMQAGLAQIGDMNPGVSDLIEGQGLGLCVTAFTPAEIARIVWVYATDRERCAREGRLARSLHLTRYNYQKAFEPILRWIEGEEKSG